MRSELLSLPAMMLGTVLESLGIVNSIEVTPKGLLKAHLFAPSYTLKIQCDLSNNKSRQ